MKLLVYILLLLVLLIIILQIQITEEDLYHTQYNSTNKL
jgi:hypothetical protein